MKNETKNKTDRTRHESKGREGPGALLTRRSGIPRPNGEVCLLAGNYLLIAVLVAAAVYLWRAPLSQAVLPKAASHSVPAAVVGRDRAEAALELCLRQIKMRDLFKPSVPVPVENRVGKSTAQELANRLQFVGTMEDSEGVAALIFIPNRGPGTFRVGDRVAEFMLVDVTSDQLTLELGDEKAVLKR